jgi:hypothetical protein
MNYRGAFNTQTSNRWNVFFCSVIILYHSRLNFIIYALCKVSHFNLPSCNKSHVVSISGGRVPGLAAYTKVDRSDRTKLSSLYRSGNVSYYKYENKIVTIPSLHRSENEG